LIFLGIVMPWCVVVLDLGLEVGRVIIGARVGLVRSWYFRLCRPESFEDGSGGAAADVRDADEL
jgi:hypothetical protein